MTTANARRPQRRPEMVLFPILLVVITTTIGLCQRADAQEAGGAAESTLLEGPLPLSDIDAVVESAERQCEAANEGKDFGIASVQDWCTIRVWSALGHRYPDLAELALEQQNKHNELLGRVNEAREQRDRYRTRNEQLSVELGRKQAKLDRQHPKWVTYAAGTAALLLGGATGYAIGHIR